MKYFYYTVLTPDAFDYSKLFFFEEHEAEHCMPLAINRHSGKLVVHVGTHKTGTTSFQSYCKDNYDILRKAKCLYPPAGRVDESRRVVINHHSLMRSIIGVSALPLEHHLSELTKEIKEADPQVIVISSEILSRDYLSSEPFELISEVFQHAKREWVIYLRSQVSYLISR